MIYMSQEKGNIKYFVIIGVILAVAFFSQQANLLGKGKSFSFVRDAVEQGQAYVAEGSNWLKAKAFPNISQDLQKRGEMVIEGVEDQKEKVSENVLEKTKNYFSGITDSILHPGNKDNCSCQD